MQDFFKNRWASILHAWEGFRFLVAREMNARIHLFITAVVIVLGLWLEVSRLEWVLLLIMVGLVLAAEALNTALEQLIDLVSPEYNLLAKRGKDLAAAAVLLLALTAIGVGLLIFVPPLWEKIISAG